MSDLDFEKALMPLGVYLNNKFLSLDSFVKEEHRQRGYLITRIKELEEESSRNKTRIEGLELIVARMEKP